MSTDGAERDKSANDGRGSVTLTACASGLDRSARTNIGGLHFGQSCVHHLLQVHREYLVAFDFSKTGDRFL